MSGQPSLPPAVRSALRRVLGPLLDRFDQVQAALEATQTRQEELAARLEQLARAQDRLAAYQDRFTEEIRAEFGSLLEVRTGAAAIVGELVEPGHEAEAGLALRNELDHAVRSSKDEVDRAMARLHGSVAELKGSNRLTQALVERLSATVAGAPAAAAAVADGPPAGAAPSVAPAPVPAARAFAHPSPGFDLLYRAFEDRHRGTPEDIRARQQGDYLELLSALPNGELPIVDLGCGRGEFVHLLTDAGQVALGVDSNASQVLDAVPGLFEEADLFDWLDRRDDGSVRAVVCMHVVEHLPADLQVRLVFESHRVLAPGGALVLETPNTLSLSVAASNFWVDPTHERPVHPLFLEFLADEAGFVDVETLLLHPVPAGFRGPDSVRELIDDLDSLILGAGDLALVARR